MKVTYLRSQLSSQSDVVQKEIEPNFTNVNYWLIFPFHVAWDTSAAVTDADMQKLPIGKSFCRSGRGEISLGRRPHTRRHLGALRRQRQPGAAIYLPPGRTQKAKPSHRNLGGLQESRPSPVLNGPPQDGGRQAATDFFFGRVREADRLRYLGDRAMNKERAASDN